MSARRGPLGAAGAAVIVAMIVAATVPFVLPVVAPQATCDLLAPILCEGGAAPTCGLQGHTSHRGRNGASLVVTCPEGRGSAAPIYLLAGAIAVLSLVAGIAFLVVRANRWRRQAPSGFVIQRRR